MSGAPDDGLDLRAELARIDRDRAETRKLMAETEKFVAEQHKLIAEGRNLTWFAPVLSIAAVVGGLLGIATFIAHLMGH